MTCQLMGANALLYLKEEVAGYGVSPSGNYLQAPFVSADIGAHDAMENRVVLGYGRNPQRQSRNAPTQAGRIVVPLDTVFLGWWLKGLLGPPVSTSGAGNVSHFFQSGKQALSSFTLEFAQPGGASVIYQKYPGTVVNTADLAIGADGSPNLTLGVICQQEIEDNVDISGTPVVVTPAYYNNKQGFVNLNGTAIGKIVEAALTANNNYETQMYAGGGGIITCADGGQFALSGTLQTRFTDLAMANLAIGQTVADFNFGWLIDANHNVTWEYDQVDILRDGNPLTGPGARTRTFALQGSTDPTEGDALHVTLVNTQASY